MLVGLKPILVSSCVQSFRAKNVKNPATGKVEQYTKTPTRLIRSKKLDPYDKVIFIVIASYHPSFPSYEKIAEDANCSRDRVWKSIKNLESKELIIRHKMGRKNVYSTYWTSLPDGLLDAPPVCHTDSTSLPHRLQPVCQADSNYINESDQSNQREETFGPKEETVKEIMTNLLKNFPL